MRINVEDDWFADPLKRRAKLIRAMASVPLNPEWMADGAALDAWRLSQRFWQDGKKLIPEELWANSGLEPLISCGLAERRPGGIYVRGAESQHDWILQKAIAGTKGGLKSAQVRAEKYGTAIPQGAQNSPKHDRSGASADTEAPPKQLRSITEPSSPALLFSTDLSNSPNGESRSADRPAVALVRIWNTHRGTLPEARKLSDVLKRKAKVRWNEEPSEEYWAACVKKMAASEFCCSGGWASIHWLLKNEDNHRKVTAGNYDNRDGSAPSREDELNQIRQRLLADGYSPEEIG